ncbi:MAG: hypothetical protein ACQEUZ_17790 [Pseudomonadota bacterium]
MAADFANILLFLAVVLVAAAALWAGIRGLRLARGPARQPQGELRGEPRSRAGRLLVAALSGLLILGVIGALFMVGAMWFAGP